MVRRSRLDSELVRRGLARSREQAGALVDAGLVRVAGRPATKAATAVDPGTAVLVRPEPSGEPAYASRGGYKLAGALDAFAPSGLSVLDRRCLDAGASTGGFTDVLLRRGARSVLAVDVGYGQLSWSLRGDRRVRVLDRTNVRALTGEQVGEPVGVLTADLAFISLRLVLPALIAVGRPDADLLLMVKPQFEVGRDRLGPGGVVRDPLERTRAVGGLAAAAAELGLGTAGVVASSLPGPAGNVEYFLWLHAGAPAPDAERIAAAVADGPR